jgi:hypothetical protein
MKGITEKEKVTDEVLKYLKHLSNTVVSEMISPRELEHSE